MIPYWVIDNLDVIAVLSVSGVALVSSASAIAGPTVRRWVRRLVRNLRRPVRWKRPDDDDRIVPDVAAERLIDALARGPIRTHAALLVGGVTVSATWRVDLKLPQLGWWDVRVGPHAGPAGDLSVVYAMVKGRLEAIVREREAAKERARGPRGAA